MSGEIRGNTAPVSPGVQGNPVPKPLPWARAVADLLTLSRFVGGVALALTPWERSVDSLGRLVHYGVLLWSTDAVDGRIARRSGTPASWLGKHDVLVDSMLALGVGVALARAGYLPGVLVGAWLGACLVLYALRPVATVALIFMLPLQLALPILAWVHARSEIWLYLAWVGAVALMNRTRLKFVIETFIEGLPGPLRAWIWSWLPGWLRLTSEERASFEQPPREF